MRRSSVLSDFHYKRNDNFLDSFFTIRGDWWWNGKSCLFDDTCFFPFFFFICLGVALFFICPFFTLGWFLNLLGFLLVPFLGLGSEPLPVIFSPHVKVGFVFEELRIVEIWFRRCATIVAFPAFIFLCRLWNHECLLWSRGRLLLGHRFVDQIKVASFFGVFRVLLLIFLSFLFLFQGRQPVNQSITLPLDGVWWSCGS